MTLLYRDDMFLRHDTGNHPERIERLQSINAALDKNWFGGPMRGRLVLRQLPRTLRQPFTIGE